MKALSQLRRGEGKFLVGGMLVCLFYAVILDLKRQSDTLMLRLDKVFQKIAGLDDYLVQSTISRFLKSFRVETAKGIAHVNHKILREARGNFKGWTKITLDLDSHVRTAYGHQQGLQWDIILRNQIDRAITPYFASSERQEIFYMESSAQGRLILLVG